MDSQDLQGKPESTEVNKLHPDKNRIEQLGHTAKMYNNYGIIMVY
jgi:hypothetical protein